MRQLHVGRLLDHVQFRVHDLEASARFYRACLEALGHAPAEERDGYFWADELFFSEGGQPTARMHLAFQAADRAAVDRFYRAALEAGGRDNGPPGERPHYHSGYYAAFVLDPDGNNVEAVYHGPTRRSADEIVIEPQ